MRAIERTTQFKRDFKCEMKGRHRATLESDLPTVPRALAGDTRWPRNTAIIRYPATGPAFATAMSGPTSS